jgi:predicted lipoprotein with Yx(FWY)xxD motif
MTGTRRITFPTGFAVTAAAVLTLVACSSGGQSSAPAPPSNGGKQGTVDVATTSLGQTLVDSQGSTLYLFQKDTGSQSECTGVCAASWPPLRAKGKPTAGSGANASLLGTTPRSDGAPQVTYNGHPVYQFSGDQQPGETNGEGVSAFGGSWFALSQAGDQISSSTSNSGGGPGY